MTAYIQRDLVLCTATTANAPGDSACQGEVKIKRNDDVGGVRKEEV